MGGLKTYTEAEIMLDRQTAGYLLMQSGDPVDWQTGAALLLELAGEAIRGGDPDGAMSHLRILTGELLKASPTLAREIELCRLRVICDRLGIPAAIA